MPGCLIRVRSRHLLTIQNTPPWQPASEVKMPKQIRSAYESHREWIEEQVRLGEVCIEIENSYIANAILKAALGDLKSCPIAVHDQIGL